MDFLPVNPTGSALDGEMVQKTSTTATLWRGSRKLIEQPGSPAWTVGSPAKCTRVFHGPYDVAMAHWPLSGMTMRDMPDGWTIEDGATVVRARGTKGIVNIPLVSYTFQQVDYGADSDETPAFSFKRKPIDKNLELHPRYRGIVTAAQLEKIDEAVNSKGAVRATAKATFASVPLALEIYNYRLQGTDQYRLWQPVVTRKYFTPKSGAFMPSDPPAGIWEQPPHGPSGYYYYKTDGEIEWVYEGRKIKGWWTIEEWTGFDTKDLILYP